MGLREVDLLFRHQYDAPVVELSYYGRRSDDLWQPRRALRAHSHESSRHLFYTIVQRGYAIGLSFVRVE